MNKIPKLRIKVEPYGGIWNKWEWSVERAAEYKGHDIWLTAGYGGFISGYSRSKEKAILKARKSAAKHCEALLRNSDEAKTKQELTHYEPVTCQEEPV